MAERGSAVECLACRHQWPVDNYGIVHALHRLPEDLTPAQRIGQWPVTARVYGVWRMRAMTMLSGESFPPESEWQMVYDLLPKVERGVYLDNATATGFLGRAVARRLRSEGIPGCVIANDISLAMLRAAAGAAARDGVADRMLFLHADSHNLPVRSSSIDGIVCGGSMNEFEDPERVAGELSRVLRPTGSASIMLQVLSADRWTETLQRMVGRMARLRIGASGDTVQLWKRYFDVDVRYAHGAIMVMQAKHRLEVNGKRENLAA
jgi:2-polyprenyl-6-hydroxyphenyl methylase/3-demethylubiquinone-9 3-methyltransferase